MYCQRSKCFWNRYNAAWPCRGEPTGDHAVPTAAQLASHLITGQLYIQVSWYRKSACERNTTGVSWRKSNIRRTTLQGRRKRNLIWSHTTENGMMWTKSKQRVPTQNDPVRGKTTSSATWKLLVPTQGCPKFCQGFSRKQVEYTKPVEADNQNATISISRNLPSIFWFTCLRFSAFLLSCEANVKVRSFILSGRAFGQLNPPRRKVFCLRKRAIPFQTPSFELTKSVSTTTHHSLAPQIT
jgi:hypothetical protein